MISSIALLAGAEALVVGTAGGIAARASVSMSVGLIYSTTTGVLSAMSVPRARAPPSREVPRPFAWVAASAKRPACAFMRLRCAPHPLAQGVTLRRRR